MSEPQDVSLARLAFVVQALNIYLNMDWDIYLGLVLGLALA